MPWPTRMGKAHAGRWGAAQLLSDFTALPPELTSLFPTRQRGSWRKRPTPHSCALKVGAETPDTVVPPELCLCTEQGDQMEAVWCLNNSRTIWRCIGSRKSGILELLWVDKAIQPYPVLKAPSNVKPQSNHITDPHQWVARSSCHPLF